MKKTLLRRIGVAASALAIVVTTVFAGVSSAQTLDRRSGPGGYGTGLASLPATTPLSAEEINALNVTLQDEYRAWAIYDQVIQDFGDVAPFVNIREAEANHADALIRLFDKYGVEVPENDWIGQVPSFESVTEACEAGVQAEIDNAGLYDSVLAASEHVDLTRVFTNLQSASLNMHLPAFEACASGTGAGTAFVDENGDGVCDLYGTSAASTLRQGTAYAGGR